MPPESKSDPEQAQAEAGTEQAPEAAQSETEKRFAEMDPEEAFDRVAQGVKDAATSAKKKAGGLLKRLGKWGKKKIGGGIVKGARGVEATADGFRFAKDVTKEKARKVGDFLQHETSKATWEKRYNSASEAVKKKADEYWESLTDWDSSPALTAGKLAVGATVEAGKAGARKVVETGQAMKEGVINTAEAVADWKERQIEAVQTRFETAMDNIDSRRESGLQERVDRAQEVADKLMAAQSKVEELGLADVPFFSKGKKKLDRAVKRKGGLLAKLTSRLKRVQQRRAGRTRVPQEGE